MFNRMNDMKRPENIEVGNRTYKVVIDSTLLLREGLFADCDHQKLKISINPRFSSGQLDETLWHEVIHIINSVFLNNKLNEEDINSLGNGLTQAVQSMGISFEWEEGAIQSSL